MSPVTGARADRRCFTLSDNLIDYNIGLCDQVYSSGNFTCVQVMFRLKRRIGYYIFHT